MGKGRQGLWAIPSTDRQGANPGASCIQVEPQVPLRHQATRRQKARKPLLTLLHPARPGKAT